jgi:phosphoribosylamine---glycine ligase
MRVLVIGSGGREHALCVALARSSRLTKLFAAPGNVGIGEVAECVDLALEDVKGLLAFAKREKIDLTVVGPEGPLVLGIADAFRAAGLRIFGPTAACARLEGSKAFTKELCRKYHVPTGSFRVFHDAAAAREYIEAIDGYPLVLKADGLAAGKGVIIATEKKEALEAIERFMVTQDFGEAGARLVIEEFLSGSEASVIAIVDGRTIATLEPARDHKQAFDFDRGPNTGGMGAVCPASNVTPALLRQIESQILVPVVHALAREGHTFVGFLYAGLMLTKAGPKVLEFNVRLGDPEAQAILPRLRSDLVEILTLAADGKLDQSKGLDWDPRPCAAVVLASGGYPGTFQRGFPIDGLRDARESDVFVFHAGTAIQHGRCVTAGGRVLTVSALGDDVRAACERAYRGVAAIQFQNAFYRTDIGRKDCEASA